jgi:hypothetical protein
VIRSEARAAIGLDDLIPTYDVRSRHEGVAMAPARDVWAAVDRLRFADASPWVRVLLRLRGIPDLSHLTLRRSLDRLGFRVLVDRPGEELIAGVMGRFWALDERGTSLVTPVDGRELIEFDVPGYAAAVLSLRLEPVDEGRTRIVTETRVRGTDAAARRRLAAYWLLIRPFSGFLRRDLLRAVARLAEVAAG